mmetsp:Transcript_49918/g.100520  ORF Transcript_49918/g.100520 Transcript_49918/m.100520 type:complete len:239 (+) Transcript_49918:64-780(+)
MAPSNSGENHHRHCLCLCHRRQQLQLHRIADSSILLRLLPELWKQQQQQQQQEQQQGGVSPRGAVSAGRRSAWRARRHGLRAAAAPRVRARHGGPARRHRKRRRQPHPSGNRAARRRRRRVVSPHPRAHHHCHHFVVVVVVVVDLDLAIVPTWDAGNLRSDGRQFAVRGHGALVLRALPRPGTYPRRGRPPGRLQLQQQLSSRASWRVGGGAGISGWGWRRHNKHSGFAGWAMGHADP